MTNTPPFALWPRWLTSMWARTMTEAGYPELAAVLNNYQDGVDLQELMDEVRQWQETIVSTLRSERDNARECLALAAEVLVRDGYFTDDEIGPDLAPRLTEWLTHHQDQLTEVREALHEALSQFAHKTYPGRPCLQSGHVHIETVAKWHRTLADSTRITATSPELDEAKQPPAACGDHTGWAGRIVTCIKPIYHQRSDRPDGWNADPWHDDGRGATWRSTEAQEARR